MWLFIYFILISLCSYISFVRVRLTLHMQLPVMICRYILPKHFPITDHNSHLCFFLQKSSAVLLVYLCNIWNMCVCESLAGVFTYSGCLWFLFDDTFAAQSTATVRCSKSASIGFPKHIKCVTLCIQSHVEKKPFEYCKILWHWTT